MYGNETTEFVNIRDLITDSVRAMWNWGILPQSASKEEVVAYVRESTGLPIATNSIGANIAYGTYNHYRGVH